MNGNKTMEKDVIRTVLSCIEKQHLSPKDVLTQVILASYDKYLNEKDDKHLVQASIFVEIYDEMDLQRETYHDIFEKILELSIRNSDRRNLGADNNAERVVVNKSQIRRLLGRWNPRVHSMPIGDVVEDIIDKVTRGQNGTYCYWTEQRVGKKQIRFEYSLSIKDKEIYFYDYYNNRVHFLEGGDKNG